MFTIDSTYYDYYTIKYYVCIYDNDSDYDYSKDGPQGPHFDRCVPIVLLGCTTILACYDLLAGREDFVGNESSLLLSTNSSVGLFS